MSFNVIMSIMGIISGLYALPYGIWEFKRKNRLGAVVVCIVAVLCMFLSVFQNFV